MTTALPSFLRFLPVPGSIEPTVRRIRDNGNAVTFNYYSEYGRTILWAGLESRLLDELLRVREAYPETVINTPYSIRTLITGKTHWAQFGYDVCPSISTGNHVHEERLANGQPVLPGFNSYAPDATTLNFCCASANCDGCRDSQAVYSWLLLSMKHFLDSPQALEEWMDTAESYWGNCAGVRTTERTAHDPVANAIVRPDRIDDDVLRRLNRNAIADPAEIRRFLENVLRSKLELRRGTNRHAKPERARLKLVGEDRLVLSVRTLTRYPTLRSSSALAFRDLPTSSLAI